MTKKSADDKTENPVELKFIIQKYANQVIDAHAKNFLTEAEMKKFFGVPRKGRHSVRDFCLMLVAYRHGLRVSELIDIRLKDLAVEENTNKVAAFLDDEDDDGALVYCSPFRIEYRFYKGSISD